MKKHPCNNIAFIFVTSVQISTFDSASHIPEQTSQFYSTNIKNGHRDTLQGTKNRAEKNDDIEVKGEETQIHPLGCYTQAEQQVSLQYHDNLAQQHYHKTLSGEVFLLVSATLTSASSSPSSSACGARPDRSKATAQQECRGVHQEVMIQHLQGQTT